METALSLFRSFFSSIQTVLDRRESEKGHCGTNMASVKTLLWLGFCLSSWNIVPADENLISTAENPHWVSLDFTTILKWTTKQSDYKYTVLYALFDTDWRENPNCIEIPGTECDLTAYLQPFNRTYLAKVLTEFPETDYSSYTDDLPQAYSPKFNPYRESNISAVEFTVEAEDERRVTVNITDPLTSIHDNGKQLSIRDILKKDLKYKISYYKSGSTGKRDVISDSNMAEVQGLDAGKSYCFMVAAFIPTRPKATQQGAWSKQLCTQGHWNNQQDLSVGAWVGVSLIVLTVLIITIVTIFFCRRCQERNKNLRLSQSSAL